MLRQVDRGVHMNSMRFAATLIVLGCGAPCMATDCLLPASLQLGNNFSTVAPEMQRPAPTDPFCVSAQEAITRIRAKSSPAGADSAYVPLTKDDNTPWRFNMSQNGKQMTSVEFDAWMKAKGIRVATGKPGTAPVGSDVPLLPAQPAP